jgi:RHH-type proline utilization regulon transcriptional repressor/proline dehydrogenase/delta 1-pyrroline-5-carboxylate dehydrogenase
MLEGAADRLEADMPRLVTLLVREAGKTAANAVSEVREAVDFLRYYAQQVRRDFDNARHRRSARWSASARGTSRSRSSPARSRRRSPRATRCSPSRPSRRRWSPPRRCGALRAAGVPRRRAAAPAGRGESVGAALVGDARVRACSSPARPRSPAAAASLAGRLGAHGRPVPLVAETGGQNAMVVDSSALAEQVVADVVSSAFDSAGQRCSALRVLCVQRDLARAC